MKYRLDVWQDRPGDDWYWHITAANGRIVCHGEGYRRRGDLLTMLGRLFKGTPIEQQVEELRRSK